ncbi:PREDICTED: uncharacterized protein LOC102253566 isoform X2 [Myotis brandtii]|uniref:uncharacterized protein LOC102253566 isoform X2 n=1 Tax=Myotis brandtii TaxID=109478 RepID=UPI000703C46B|nr:PREDICTED: uncharacterized protein LOC102253566 isoform X2 [Myotis brandtii]
MASEPAGLISMILQSRPGACDNTSRGKSRRSQAPGLWQRMPACPPTASLAPEPGRELSKAVEKEVAPAGKQTERLLDFLTGPAHARGLRASSERPARLRNSPFLLWGLPSPTLAPFTGSLKTDCKALLLREAFPDLLL